MNEKHTKQKNTCRASHLHSRVQRRKADRVGALRQQREGQPRAKATAVRTGRTPEHPSGTRTPRPARGEHESWKLCSGHLLTQTGRSPADARSKGRLPGHYPGFHSHIFKLCQTPHRLQSARIYRLRKRTETKTPESRPHQTHSAQPGDGQGDRGLEFLRALLG